MASEPKQPSVGRAPDWRELGLEKQKVLYEEATRAAYYFSEWRNKLLAYFLTFGGGLGVATEWLAQHHRGGLVAAPFASGYVVALLLCWMDYRNHLLLRIAQGVAASIEEAWGMPGLSEATTRWAYRPGGADSGFYGALVVMQPFRGGSEAWGRRQRYSSYSVTITVWFEAAAIAFACGTGFIASSAAMTRGLIVGAMIVGSLLFLVATRDGHVPRSIRAELRRRASRWVSRRAKT